MAGFSTRLIDVVIVGAGGFGHEVLDVVQRAAAAGATVRFLGFLDDGTPDPHRLARRGAALIGPVTACPPQASYVIAVGDPAVRHRLDGVLAVTHRAAPAVIDPAATIGTDVALGDGTLVLAGARVSTDARLGRHCHVNLNAVVGHDAVLGDCVSISPCAALGGNVTIGDRVLVGTGASIVPGVTVGSDVIIGAGAAVIDDVPTGCTVVGVPARPVRSQLRS